MKEKEKLFLTEKQLKVLELRAKGYKQGKIASLMGTTRENITLTEKRAKDNIKKARNTLRYFEMLSPVEISIEEGVDIFDLPNIIFNEATAHGIKVLQNATSLIGICRRKQGNKIMGNRIVDPIKVKILRNGEVVF